MTSQAIMGPVQPGEILLEEFLVPLGVWPPDLCPTWSG
jgi:plasmid maintenance system antidote protein VapI